MTEYFAVVGPSTASARIRWKGSCQISLTPKPMTIMVIEAAGKHVPMNEPSDLTMTRKQCELCRVRGTLA